MALAVPEMLARHWPCITRGAANSLLRPRRGHDSRGGERRLRIDWARAHEADPRLRKQRLDEGGRLQRPPPRHARVHILQEVVAVSCTWLAMLCKGHSASFLADSAWVLGYKVFLTDLWASRALFSCS